MVEMANSSVGTRIIVARNTASDSSNKIHDDAEARRYGYGGGLVPGVTLYAYLTQLAIEQFGFAWLERGTADFSIRRPVYEGETVRCEGDARDDGSLELRVMREDVRCADGTFGLTEAIDSVPTCPHGPAPVGALPLLTPETVPLGVPLAPIQARVDADDAAAYAESTADPSLWYRKRSPLGPPVVPPGWLAARQAALQRANFSFGPSIHTRSVVQHHAPAPVGHVYTTGGTIRSTFERKGNHYLLLDAVTQDEAGRVVFVVQHTSIFSVRQVAGA